MVYYGYDIASTLLQFGQASPAMGIPMGLVYVATPLGFGLTIIRLIQQLVIQFKTLVSNEEGNIGVTEHKKSV